MAPSKILIADDDSLVREAVVKILEMFGHSVIAVESGRAALQALNEDLDVIILDINMPDMDGFETIAKINERNLDIPVLFFTGAGSMEYAVKAINLGAYDFLSKPIEDLDLFDVKIRRAIEKRMYVLKDKAYKKNLEVDIQAKTHELGEKNLLLEQYSHELEASTVNTIMTLQTALEEKDQYTAGHTTRVTAYSQQIATAMQLPQEELTILRRACQLHDIGKLVIDVSCIQKPGPLTAEEWEKVKKHPEVGETIIRPLRFLKREGEIVRHHHERMDGRGYPDQLTGKDLDILTKIVTVADSYDAMTSKRSYKVNLSREQAIAEVERCSGTQFEPEVVKAFIASLQKG